MFDDQRVKSSLYFSFLILVHLLIFTTFIIKLQNLEVLKSCKNQTKMIYSLLLALFLRESNVETKLQ
jgi:hypothetical protein